MCFFILFFLRSEQSASPQFSAWFLLQMEMLSFPNGIALDFVAHGT